MRYFLKLSFSGKNYHGWQIQQNAHSVQAEVDKALSTFLKEEIATVGCGRTDTGVHARVFYVHFDFHSPVDQQEFFIHHLNCLLPHDIAIQELIKVPDNAHARFDAVSRTYQYYIYHQKDPFLNESAYFFPYELDLKKMNHCCALLIEHADFSSFSKSRTQVKTNICKLAEANWRKENNLLIFRITADRFLRNMVRAIVGTMLDVGENKIDETKFQNIIAGKSRSNAGFSVPAHGLYLEDVKYGFVMEA